MGTSIRRATNLEKALTNAVALKEVVRELDRRGNNDGKLQNWEMQKPTFPDIRRPDAVWFTFTSARSAGDVSIKGLQKRVTVATAMLKAADKDHDGKLSQDELRNMRGAGVAVALCLLRDGKSLDKLLKKLSDEKK